MTVKIDPWLLGYDNQMEEHLQQEREREAYALLRKDAREKGRRILLAFMAALGVIAYFVWFWMEAAN
jgi:hypothetical protein